jgi:RNA polymerase sigma factor (TIGR02999 family)
VSASEGITAVLVAHRDGEAGAFNRLIELIYPELRRIARGQLRRWRPDVPLGTESCVHEAYLKLVDQSKANWQDRNHFYAIAARAMRQVIIDYARRRGSRKRGGGAPHLTLNEHGVAAQQQADQLIALEELLAGLEGEDPRLLQIVECRFFAGYSEAETADILGISSRTVERDWLRAKSWLREAMSSTANAG